MKIIQIPQNTQEWHDFRRGKITGTKSAGCLSLSRKSKDGSTVGMGWWEMLAERLTGNDEADISDNAMKRGSQLEGDCAEITVRRLGLENPNFEPGIWQSSENERLILSPDCYENVEFPTWAIECKSLGSAKHLQAIYRALEYTHAGYELGRFSAIATAELKGQIDLIPQEYREQALDYFIVNPHLEVLYFTLYDPRFNDSRLAHWVFTIMRADIEDNLIELGNAQLLTIDEHDLAEAFIKKELGGIVSD